MIILKLLAFGEILWDVYPEEKHIGGAPFNFASHCARQGAEAYLLSAVGNDALGKEAVGTANLFGIKTDYVSVLSQKETGKCVVTLDENKIPSYELMTDVAYDFIEFPEDDGFDLLYFGTLALRQEHNRKIVRNIIKKNVCKKIISDVNVRNPFCSKESLMIALENANYLKVSDEEMGYVSESILGKEFFDATEFAEKLSEKFSNLELIILTFGENGSGVYDCINKKEYRCKAHKTQVVSSVGAGDSFAASFVVALHKGLDIMKCLEIASRVSSFVVSKKEAVPRYDISDFI